MQDGQNDIQDGQNDMQDGQTCEMSNVGTL